MISMQEKKRRYEALRAAMRAQGCEVFVAAGKEGAVGRGFIRYLTDFHMWGGNSFVVVPLEGEPTFQIGSESQTFWSGQVGWLTDLRYSAPAIDGLIARLRELGSPKRIHVAGLGQYMMYDDTKKLIDAFPDSEIIDATEMLHNIILIKSQEELDLMQDTADAVCAAMHRFAKELRPGKTEREVVSCAWQEARQRGIVDGIAHISNRFPPFIQPPTDRVIEKDDVIKFSMEMAGQSGYWIELAAIFSFDKAPEDQLREFETTKLAVDEIAKLLRPGTVGGEIAKAVERVFADAGYKDVSRIIWDSHGIGLDVIEYPVLVGGHPVVLQENMAISVHPGLTVGPERMGVYIQDNFIVKPGGAKQQSAWEHKWHIL